MSPSAVPGRHRRRARWVLSASCASVIVVGAWQIDRLCGVEAAIGSAVVAATLGSSSHPSASSLVFYPVAGGAYRALEITWQCSTYVAALPLLLLTALAALLPSARPRSMVAVLVAGLVVVASANQLRLLVIAAATARWGDDGFEVAHRLVGSGIVLLSVVAGLAAIVRLHGRTTSPRTEVPGT